MWSYIYEVMLKLDDFSKNTTAYQSPVWGLCFPPFYSTGAILFVYGFMIFFSWMSRDWGTLNVDIYNVIYFYLNELRKVKPQKRVSIHSLLTLV